MCDLKIAQVYFFYLLYSLLATSINRSVAHTSWWGKEAPCDYPTDACRGLQVEKPILFCHNCHILSLIRQNIEQHPTRTSQILSNRSKPWRAINGKFHSATPPHIGGAYLRHTFSTSTEPMSRLTFFFVLLLLYMGLVGLPLATASVQKAHKLCLHSSVHDEAQSLVERTLCTQSPADRQKASDTVWLKRVATVSVIWANLFGNNLIHCFDKF